MLEPREYELETNAGKDVDVKGNLLKHVDFWVNIGTPKYILDLIKEGYRLPFEDYPTKAYLKNNKSSLNHCGRVYHGISLLQPCIWSQLASLCR